MPQQKKGGSPAYFLLHMPRTGGNTIAAHLQAHLGEGFCSPGRPSALAMLGGGRRHRLDHPPDFAGVRAVGGHYLGRSLERRFPGREIRRTLLLRDPVGFHVSYYNHRMMFSLSRGGPVCDFERHLRAQPRDLVALLLLWYWLELPLARLLTTGDEQKYQLVNKALAGFWFVGSHLEGDRLLAAIAADLGVPQLATRRNTTLEWRKRVGWQPLRADDLSPATRRAILVHNPIHNALWHSWRDAGFAPAAVLAQPFSPGSGEMGMRDLVRSVLADRVIAPVWRKAARAIRARDWTAAARHYRKALRRVPGQPEVWAQYGHVLREAGDAAGAEAAYRRAIALDPQFGEWRLFLGHALARQGRPAEARDEYRQFERLDPAGLHRKREELVALGHSEESVRGFWRSVTGEAGPV